MIIKVEGEVIETESIYRVGKVYWDKHGSHFGIWHNHHTCTIITSGNDGKLKTLRDKVIEVWQANQTTIPEYNL